jgi:hypothetical protein
MTIFVTPLKEWSTKFVQYAILHGISVTENRTTSHTHHRKHLEKKCLGLVVLFMNLSDHLLLYIG